MHSIIPLPQGVESLCKLAKCLTILCADCPEPRCPWPTAFSLKQFLWNHRGAKLAVVGADARWWCDERLPKAVIETLILAFQPSTVISGACPYGGVDTWAEEIARAHSIPVITFPPRGRAWRYYRERNTRIAREADVVVDVEPYGRAWSGGMWTLRYATRVLGKAGLRVDVSPKKLLLSFF